jgi:hypothetical protein
LSNNNSTQPIFQDLIIDKIKLIENSNIEKRIASEMATVTTTTTSTGTITHHPNLSSRKSSSSDEDIVHTVTNVYQIPVIQQQQHSQNSILNDSTTKASDLSGLSHIGVINNNNNRGHNIFNVETLVDGEEIQSKTNSKTFTTSKITHKVIDEQQKPTGVPVKEKYQIRSIVEIYENPNTNETIDISKTKINNYYEETHNYITKNKKFDDSTDLSFSSKNKK